MNLPARPFLALLTLAAGLLLTLSLTGCGSARRVSADGVKPEVYHATPERLRSEYQRKVAPLPPGRTVTSFAILDPKTYQLAEVWLDGTNGRTFSQPWSGNDF